MTPPLFTVIIPTYNRAYIIEEAIESILCQGIDPIQILVIDDGSTDNTQEVLSPYFGQIDYYYQKNQGASTARNKGFELAKGEFVCLLDSDDIYREDKLKKELSLFRQYPDIDLVISPTGQYKDNSPTPISTIRDELKMVKTPTLLSELYPWWHKGNIAPTCGHTFRRSFLEANPQVRYDTNLKTWEDWDFASRCYHYGTAMLLPDVTSIVRCFPDDTRGKRHMPGQPRTAEQEAYRKQNWEKVAQRVTKMIGYKEQPAYH